jgi:cupin 2 domain-containing protein
MSKAGNLFSLDVEPEKGVEQRETVGAQVGLSITRSVSVACSTPPGAWCNDGGQGMAVLVLSGEAGVLIKGEKTPRILACGDYLMVQGTKRYRIDWTHPSEPTVWLAIRKAAGAEESVVASNGEPRDTDIA